MRGPTAQEGLPYLDLNTHLRRRFGVRVQKLSLDAGLSCPNRDGRVGTGGCLYCNARGSGTGAAARGVSLTAQIQEGMGFLQSATAPRSSSPIFKVSPILMLRWAGCGLFIKRPWPVPRSWG